MDKDPFYCYIWWLKVNSRSIDLQHHNTIGLAKYLYCSLNYFLCLISEECFINQVGVFLHNLTHLLCGLSGAGCWLTRNTARLKLKIIHNWRTKRLIDLHYGWWEPARLCSARQIKTFRLQSHNIMWILQCFPRQMPLLPSKQEESTF